MMARFFYCSIKYYQILLMLMLIDHMLLVSLIDKVRVSWKLEAGSWKVL